MWTQWRMICWPFTFVDKQELLAKRRHRGGAICLLYLLLRRVEPSECFHAAMVIMSHLTVYPRFFPTARYKFADKHVALFSWRRLISIFTRPKKAFAIMSSFNFMTGPRIIYDLSSVMRNEIPLRCVCSAITDDSRVWLDFTLSRERMSAWIF